MFWIALELAVIIVIALWALVAAGKFLQLVRHITQTLDEIKNVLQANLREPRN